MVDRQRGSSRRSLRDRKDSDRNILILTGILQQGHARSRYFFRYVVVVHAAAPYQTSGTEVDRSTAAQNAADAEAALELGAFVFARLRYH